MADEQSGVRVSTPEAVGLTVLATTVSLPLAVEGLTTLTGLEAGAIQVFGGSWVVLGALALGSALAVPYGAVLGLATLPVSVRTDPGYGPPAGAGRFDHRLEHLAGGVLYASLATFSAGVGLAATARVDPSGTLLADVASVPGIAALLAGSAVVAAAFLAAQCYQHRARNAGVDDRVLVGYSLYAAALLPAPFAALAVLDLLVAADVWAVAIVGPR